MAYTIVRSNGTTLCTIPDGTINTQNSSLGLPGRNAPSYGQTLDTNFVRMLENFADGNVPSYPLRGQLWYNTTLNTLNICPADGTTNAAQWTTIATTSSGGTATLGNVTVTGNITTNNISVANATASDTVTARLVTVSANLTATNANITGAEIGTLVTSTVTSGATTTAGSLTGEWSVYGNASGSSFSINTGNITFTSNTVGVKCDNYMYSNGAPFNPSGTYDNANVFNFLTGRSSVTSFYNTDAPNANLQVNTLEADGLTGGGPISGQWTITTGSRLQATYADLAERYEADGNYAPGTVLELGGEKEVTLASELSDNVFGVVSTNPAYLMNATAGDDDTHPAIILAGRAHIKAIGVIKKRDRLVSAGNGYARAGTAEEITPFNVLGRALQNKDDDGAGTVEAVVIVR